MISSVHAASFGLVGDGAADDTQALQQALSSGASEILVPSGNYRITKTLMVPSDTTIRAAADARFFLCHDTPKKRGDFLLSNSDPINGNRQITILGGIWDGNFGGPNNDKDNEHLFDPEAWSGATLNFFNVKKLHLENMILANSVVYYTRFCKIEDFVIRNIGFRSDRLAYNQDGLHFAGFIKNGLVENIRVLTKGQTNDDLIALNADDSLVRLENRDLLCGPIEDIVFRDLYAEDCYTAIRMLSVQSPIRRIRFERVHTGCRNYAINMDGARYCRTPLIPDESKFPQGSGLVEEIDFDDFQIHSTADHSDAPLLCCETNVRRFHVRNFLRNRANDVNPGKITLQARNLPNLLFRAWNQGQPAAEIELHDKTQVLKFDSPMTEFRLDSVLFQKN